MATNLYVVLLSGGRGTRMGCMRQDGCNKQNILLPNGLTFMQSTMQRIMALQNIYKYLQIIHVTTKEVVEWLESQCYPLTQHFIVEQHPQGTARAIALAAMFLEGLPNSCMLIMPTDHWFVSTTNFCDAMVHLVQLACSDGEAVLLGMQPTYYEENYGHFIYDTKRILRFIEKPSPIAWLQMKRYAVKKRAQIAWYSGIFSTSAVQYLQLYAASGWQYNVEDVIIPKARYAYVADCTWCDVGNMHNYVKLYRRLFGV